MPTLPEVENARPAPVVHTPSPVLFRSFWMGGFESACHINRHGYRLDMQAATQHDVLVAHDYGLLRARNVRTVRDAVRWHLVERGGMFDFRSLAAHVRAAQQHQMQVIWDLCHYGWPDDVNLLEAAFIERFARFAQRTARHLRDHLPGPAFYCPINEISFLAWTAGEVGWMHPFGQGRGGEVKRQLVRAAIAGCEAIWAVDPEARIVHVDPLIHVLAPRNRPYLSRAAAAQHESQFEVWDMLGGRLAPELGGAPRYLDVMGLNYYHANQWEYAGGRLRWEDQPRDNRWIRLHQLLDEVYRRYGRPLLLGETSHFGAGRIRWLREIADEVAMARRLGIPLEGVCLYPILDRPDWENPQHWHNSGLWDLHLDCEGRLQRVLYEGYAQELASAQQLLAELGCR